MPTTSSSIFNASIMWLSLWTTSKSRSLPSCYTIGSKKSSCSDRSTSSNNSCTRTNYQHTQSNTRRWLPDNRPSNSSLPFHLRSSAVIATRLIGCAATRLMGCAATRLIGCAATRLMGCSASNMMISANKGIGQGTVWSVWERAAVEDISRRKMSS